MKKLIILGAILSGVVGMQMSVAQSEQTSEITMPFSRITEQLPYLTIDYTALGSEQFYRMEENGMYQAVLPFTVDKPIPAGELFWLALYTPEDNSFYSWGIHTDERKFICRSFDTYKDGEAKYILQSQGHLTQLIVPGDYLLSLNFTEMPQNEDIWISLGYSTRQLYDDYAATLAQLNSNSTDGAQAADRSSQLAGTEWHYYYDDYEYEYEEDILRFLNEKKVELEWEWIGWLEFDEGNDKGTYTFDGSKGVITWESGEQQSFTIDGDKLKLGGTIYNKVK